MGFLLCPLGNISTIKLWTIDSFFVSCHYTKLLLSCTRAVASFNMHLCILSLLWHRLMSCPTLPCLTVNQCARVASTVAANGCYVSGVP